MARNPFANLGKSRADSEKKDTGPTKQDDQDEAEKARKAKRKAKGEEDSDDEDEDDDEEGSKKDKDDEKDAKASAARGRERARVRAILTSGPGLANPVLSAHMALDTDMPRRSAVQAIASMNAATKTPDYDPDEDARGEGVSPMAAAILAAGAKRRGEAPTPMPGQRERMGVRADAPPSPPKHEDMAARIIAAGARRRGETPPDLPKDPAARAMVEADRRRRGEI